MDMDVMKCLHQYGIDLDKLIRDMFEELKQQQAIENGTEIEGHEIVEVDGKLVGPVHLTNGNAFQFELKLRQH